MPFTPRHIFSTNSNQFLSWVFHFFVKVVIFQAQVSQWHSSPSSPPAGACLTLGFVFNSPLFTKAMGLPPALLPLSLPPRPYLEDAGETLGLGKGNAGPPSLEEARSPHLQPLLVQPQSISRETSGFRQLEVTEWGSDSLRFSGRRSAE